MSNKQLIVKRQLEHVDVWYASHPEILEICKNITGSEIQKISISDKNYPDYTNHAKDFLSLGNAEGWQFVFYSDFRKEKLIEESCTSYPLEMVERACRVVCDEFRIFKNIDEAMKFNFKDPQITQAIETQYQTEQEACYGAFRQ